jgi:hypothetical protein
MLWLLRLNGNLDSSSPALCLLLSGHNGLVAAAYLAKQGRKVLVLERRYILGGAAVTEEINPGQSLTSQILWHKLRSGCSGCCPIELLIRLFTICACLVGSQASITPVAAIYSVSSVLKLSKVSRRIIFHQDPAPTQLQSLN